MSLHPHALDDLLRAHLREFLHGADDDALATLQRELEWQELPAGGVLMRQGEPGDSMVVLVSGRLRVSIADAQGRDRVVREVARGEVVGEMALITDAPRSATLVAMRDSVLARLPAPAFKALLAHHPAVSLALTRRIITRLQTEGRVGGSDRPTVVALLPLGGRADAPTAAALARALASALAPHDRVALVDAAGMTTRLGHAPGDDAESMRRMALLLDEIESAHDLVLLLADAAPTAWTRCCARQGDEVLLLAHADDDPAPGAVERACHLAGTEGNAGPRPLPTAVLLLMHPAARPGPTATARWLAPRRLRTHVHLREGHAPDAERLARLVARRGTGLVLSGGGARGAAHAGVYRALWERGVPVDAIGGTSMGAVFGALMGFDPSGDDVVNTFARHFADNPTGDVNLLPLLSLINGGRLRRMMERTELRFGGAAGLAIEDLWKPYFCIAANVTRATEQVLDSGPLIAAVMASCAVPGAMPPVLRDGELLCDGGVFNNLPTDVMRTRWGIGHVIAVDLDPDRPQRIALDALPTPWQLLLDRLRPRARRRYRLPSLPSYLMNVTALQGTARQRAATALADLVVRPELPRIGMLQWSRYALAVQGGYEAACRALDQSQPQSRRSQAGP
jgi:NTE family protein